MKKYCNVCDKDVIVDEDNKCPKCGLSFDDVVDYSDDTEVEEFDSIDAKESNSNDEGMYDFKAEEDVNSDNTVSVVLKVLALFVIVFGVIAGLAYGNKGADEFSFMSVLSYWIAAAITALFIYAFAEIIQLLQDIKDKIK